MRLAALLLLALISGCARPPQVEVDGERLTGERLADRGVSVFRGVPFAAPPVGELRWQAPQPRSMKIAERDATAFAPACMQHMGILEWYRRMAEKFGYTRDEFEDLEISEDCLYLNVWTPALDEGARLPVMVYIHGGSNDSGWAYEPDYHGHVLAERGVVMVSIAYRLGVFGFISHPELDGAGVRANFGLWDQVAALDWVQEHIGKFGGDPSRVTLFGESAGAQDILALMASPVGRGLFHGAILQSNAGFGIGRRESPTLDDERRRGVEIASLFDIDGEGALDRLRAIPAQELLDRYMENVEHYHSPAVDGKLLTEPVWQTIQSGNLAPMPLIIGSNGDEWFDRIPPDSDRDDLVRAVGEWPQVDAQRVLDVLGAVDDYRETIDRVSTAFGMLCPSQMTAAKQSSMHDNAWVYYFTRIRDGEGGALVRAYHGAELPYVFGTHARWITTTDVDRALTEQILTYWTRFAATGNPNTGGVPAWPTFRMPDPVVMEFGDTARTIAAPDAALCALLDLSDQQ